MPASDRNIPDDQKLAELYEEYFSEEVSDQVAEYLHSLGWRAPLDAQWEKLRKGLPELRRMLNAALGSSS